VGLQPAHQAPERRLVFLEAIGEKFAVLPDQGARSDLGA